jgi:hypothetical protein
VGRRKKRPIGLLASISDRPPDRNAPVNGTGRTTRHTGDKCARCGVYCKRHDYAAYIVCNSCPRNRPNTLPSRISVAHFPRVMEKIPDDKKNDHVPWTENVWRCTECC